MSSIPLIPSQEPEYAWEVATLFPEQGEWTEAEYLQLTDGTNRRIELNDGRLEFLPMPTEFHQAIAGFLYHAMLAFATKGDLGIVPFPPLRVRMSSGKYREPDVLFLAKKNLHLRANRAWRGADLVMEVVSEAPQDRQRDYETKLSEYAGAGIAEYWIVDPERRLVIVHHLREGRYAVHGEFAAGEQATSLLLSGFGIDVTALFAVVADIPE